MELTTITLGAKQLEVLKLILDFHLANDAPEDEYYDFPTLIELCDKVGVEVPDSFR